MDTLISYKEFLERRKQKNNLHLAIAKDDTKQVKYYINNGVLLCIECMKYICSRDMFKLILSYKHCVSYHVLNAMDYSLIHNNIDLLKNKIIHIPQECSNTNLFSLLKYKGKCYVIKDFSLDELF